MPPPVAGSSLLVTCVVDDKISAVFMCTLPALRNMWNPLVPSSESVVHCTDTPIGCRCAANAANRTAVGSSSFTTGVAVGVRVGVGVLVAVAVGVFVAVAVGV